MNMPNISRVNNMSVIKGLVGKKMTRTVKFMGEDVTINKLSYHHVREVQENADKLDADDAAGFELLKAIIRNSVDGGNELTDDDFDTFPLDELSRLSTEILKHSGIQGEQKGK